MGNWSDLYSGRPTESEVADVSVIADRIDNIVQGLDGTDALTAVDINGGSIDGVTIGSSSPGAVTTTALTATTADINAGTIDGATVGASTASSGAFTTITASSTANITGDTTISGSASAANGVDAGASGVFMKVKVMNIGDWNMDSTATVTVAHGLTAENIRSMSVVIRTDTSVSPINYYPLEWENTGGTEAEGEYKWQTTNIILKRTAGGDFDSAEFDDTSYNRGWITIWYEA